MRGVSWQPGNNGATPLRGMGGGGGSRETSGVFLTIASAYVPTTRAPPSVKAQFYADLQDTLDQIYITE